MRVLQIIDSLEAGGAERMAVNIANELQDHGHNSHLCVTRKEGLLTAVIDKNVGYLFLEKKGKIDFLSISRLKKYIKKHQIEVIHAHSTSAFTAVLALIFMKDKPQLIWHDHYGKANELENRSVGVLKFLSNYFNQVISVNPLLKNWAVRELHCDAVVYLENFATSSNENQLLHSLKGTAGKRIVSLANLREQKDHVTLIHAFSEIQSEFSDWSLHLCGHDFQDTYSEKIKNQINDLHLSNRVFLLGSRPDVTAVLKNCDIGILSSKSEGLPVALLEYGLNKLPVIVTDVGACKEVVSDYGIVIPSQDVNVLAVALKAMITDNKLRDRYATQFNDHVIKNYGSERYVEQLVKIYKS